MDCLIRASKDVPIAIHIQSSRALQARSADANRCTGILLRLQIANVVHSLLSRSRSKSRAAKVDYDHVGQANFLASEHFTLSKGSSQTAGQARVQYLQRTQHQLQKRTLICDANYEFLQIST